MPITVRCNGADVQDGDILGHAVVSRGTVPNSQVPVSGVPLLSVNK